MFTFAQSSGIDDTMICLRWADIAVRGVLDGRQANQQWAATRPLREHDVELHRLRADSGVNKLHHKLAVIDEQVVVAGSFNYTRPANAMNDENIVVIGDIDETDATARARQGRVARYALGEIDRIINTYSEVVA